MAQYGRYVAPPLMAIVAIEKKMLFLLPSCKFFR